MARGAREDTGPRPLFQPAHHLQHCQEPCAYKILEVPVLYDSEPLRTISLVCEPASPVLTRRFDSRPALIAVLCCASSSVVTSSPRAYKRAL
jgi:hypothetical protein